LVQTHGRLARNTACVLLCDLSDLMTFVGRTRRRTEEGCCCT
jgi:hypothetical protein